MIALITGSSGLIGSETARFFHEKGMRIVGIDNGMREYFFGKDGSVQWSTNALKQGLKNFEHHNIDIRDRDAVNALFAKLGKEIALVVHTAAQPSHDWAAREPETDFGVNAVGTLHLLEALRKHCPDAPFIFTSTNKVYGDTPNRLPIVETHERYTIDEAHPFARHGIDESMSIDASTHSIFGASKVAADVLVQEYGRYFGLKTVCFRGGCLTGPLHSGAQLHGFLSYLVKCALEGRTYTIFGYKGKQVRDNIHSWDMANVFWHFYKNPRSGEVYNMGGGTHSNCSVLEAIALIEELSGKKLHFQLSETARTGDHIWYISDVRKFQAHYPDWEYRYGIRDILTEIIASHEGRRTATQPAAPDTRPIETSL